MSNGTKSTDMATDMAEESKGNPRRAAGGGVARAIRLLDLIVSEGPLRFADLLEHSGLPKATLHRLLNELADERLIRLD